MENTTDRFRNTLRQAPGYLCRSSVISSSLWLPYALALTVVLLFALALTVDSGSEIAWFAFMSVVYGLLALILSLVAGLTYDRERPLRHAGRAMLWFMALPARAWVLFFAFLASLMVRFWWIVVLLCMVLVVIFIASDGFQSTWSNTALIVALLVAACFIVVGGVRWGNQFGSGITGGTPLGCIIIPFLFLVALFPMIFAALTVLAALFFPGLLAWLFTTGEFSFAPDPTGSGVSLEVGNTLTAVLITVGVSLVFVVLPAWVNYRKRPRLFTHVIDSFIMDF